MFNLVKHILIGSPLPTQRLSERRLNNLRALAAFSPDALSSIAYANQEIFLGLVIAGSAGLALSWPIGLAITILLAIVAISYYQTIQAYPSGGGSYVVARENLGTYPGLLAASALLIGYILTAAVSLTAGVAELISAFPGLTYYRIPLALAFLLIITLINLRGTQETGTLLALPVYFFLISYFTMLVIGLIQVFNGGQSSLPDNIPEASQALTTALILRAFASGCTALTGIEAISNSVPAFRLPESKNAGRTLIAMAILMGLLFAGSIGLTQFLAVIPAHGETILSALTRKLMGGGSAYYIVQISTLLILVVASNTSFSGFPRLAAILAEDGFFPHQFQALGDRLVYQNGILSLAFLTGTLIIVFAGDTHSLIPLFAVGVFIAFTLSQFGMVIHWWRERKGIWRLKASLNGIGAFATGVTALIIGYSKFSQGAWISLLLIPVIMAALIQIKNHYREVREQLSLKGSTLKIGERAPLRVVVPISGVHLGDLDAVEFARAIADDVTAVYIELEPGAGEKIRQKWDQLWPEVPLFIVGSPYRSVIEPLLDFLDQTDHQYDDGQLAAVILPEFIPSKWWHGLLHNQTAWLIKITLLYRRRKLGYQRVIIDVPYHLER